MDRNNVWKFIKKQWSKKIAISLCVLGIFFYNYFIGKLSEAGMIDITKWILGMLFLANVGEKFVKNPESDQGGKV